MSLTTRPRPAAHSKKRQAGHHHQSKHYLKAYWPYLPMLMTIGLGLMINSLWYSQQRVLGAASDFTSNSLLQYTNSYRAKSNETALNINSQLTAAAQAKAVDMVSKNYWSHTSPVGQSPWSFITASGYNYQSAGENLAYGFANASDTVVGWMNSPEHRANILNADYHDVGFGVASSPDFQGKGPEIVVVAEYGQSMARVAGASSTAPTIKELPGRQVSRIQLLTNGRAAWSALALSALSGAALALFIVRHGLRLHRLLRRGEVFIVHHALLDIAIVMVFTAGFILTRGSGIIR